jgi:hypothetical protein
METKVDLTKGITREVWNALVKKARAKYGEGCLTRRRDCEYQAIWWSREDREADESKVAMLLDIATSTAFYWHRKCDTESPVHCRSFYCKVIATMFGVSIPVIEKGPHLVKGSPEYRDKISATMKAHWASKRGKTSAKALVPPANPDLSFLLDPEWWDCSQPYNLSDVENAIAKARIVQERKSKYENARQQIVAIANEHGMKVYFT